MDFLDLGPKYQSFATDRDDPFSSVLKNLSQQFLEMKLPDSTNFGTVDFHFPHEQCPFYSNPW